MSEIDLGDVREYFEERAAILEFDHGISQQEAECEAIRRLMYRYSGYPEIVDEIALERPYRRSMPVSAKHPLP